MENISNQLDIKNLRDNVKRLVIKHGYKYVQFPEDHLGMKYVSFQNHLKSGKIGIDKLIIMAGLFSCGIYELFGEAEPVQAIERKATPKEYIDEYMKTGKLNLNIKKEAPTDHKEVIPPDLDLEFLSKKI